MDKRIIDGVDVSECIHYKECKNGNGRCLIFDEKCHRIGIDESNEDICYYKRFKRKEKECEELKKQCSNLKALIWYIYCGSEDNLAEDIIGEYYNCLNDTDEIYIKNFWKKIRNLEQTEGRIKINKYKQALTEIEKIAKEYQSYNRSGFKDILQIIQKVKEN